MGKPGSLNARQQRFVDQYLIDLNATQAAIRAGYSARTAEQQGPRLLGNVGVLRAIASGKEARAKVTGITAERVLAELEAMAFSDHTHYIVDDDGGLALAPGAPATAHRAISSVKHRIHRDKDGGITRDIEFRLWDKPGAVKLAGRHVGVSGFFDKLEVTGVGGGPLVPDPIATMSSDEQRRRLACMLDAARARVGEREPSPPLEREEPGNTQTVGEVDDDPAI